ncbi:MAG: cell surface protein SprA, partial [Hymenobacteraceae bacterium]|nr:cell surface protein SprA [Hymenobacteraceae bacterium]MDX5512244.1 cell surface protein SprA [Hymenobacteraceae bacterium]
NRDPEVANSYEYTFDLAYYPGERGQYNYNPQIGPDGSLPNPRQNWGGISRGITFDTDFDNANIEYVEFWLMDPFITGANGRKDASGNPVTNNTGGELILNLGSISEDLLKDQRYEFENGLPTTSNATNVDTTEWGLVSRLQFLTDAFDNTPGARQFQDVGLDGLNDAQERAFFNSNLPDPSGDNFRHHLDEAYDDAGAGILARYKNYNGMENNSPENSTLAAYALPDKEDLNRDNIINDIEQYYEYKINLQPGEENLGSKYVVDKVVATENNDQVTWYQFRIPIRQPDGNVNGISGFKSIRFMRMYMTEFEEPVVLRFLQFQFVANQWRKFLPFLSDTDAIICNPCNDVNSFTVSTVNVEKNGAVVPGTIPYVLPPGVERQRDFAATNNRRQNEQSLQLCVDGLQDSFSKAVYKNINMDMLIYKRLKMFIHAESNNSTTQDGEVNAFIRFGTDYTENYYEYTVPLTITQTTATTIQEIWPDQNTIDIAFQDFINAKVERNNSGVPRNRPYVKQLPNGKTITIVGNPDLSTVLGFMIGIQNPTTIDKADHSVCIWVNELRVSDFDNEAGWAATARLNTKLADLANITTTGSYTTYGFGGIQQKIAQRARENTARLDVNSNIALDKFIPEKLGIKVPMSVQYGNQVTEPRFDPLEGDIPLQKSLERFDDPEDRDEYRKEVTTRTTSKSISFINVRKEKTDPNAKPHIYDIENLAVSYAYSERLHTDIVTDRDFTQNYTAALAYTYSTTPKNYAPLSKVGMLQSPYLRLLKDINFTPLPSRIAFRADLDRRYNELFLQRRDPFTGKIVADGTRPTFMKSFYFNRIYDLKWDISRSLIFDYTATNRAVVDEPEGRVNDQVNEVIWDNLKRFGRTTNFDQSVALTYRLPLDKFPLTDWLSADTRYQAGYTWTAGSTALNQDTSFQLGNTIQNSTEASVAGKVDLVKLYNKVKFLNDINNPPRQPVQLRPTPQQVQKPGTPAAKDTTQKKPELKALKAVLRSLMSARSLNFNYSLNQGTMLPGYLPKTKFFGFDEGFDAPGLPFIVGKQYDLDELYQRADSRGWYTDSSQYLQTPLSNIKTHNFRANTMMQPFKNFNIQFDARWNKTNIREVLYKLPFDTVNLTYGANAVPQNPIETGSFSMSFITVQTLFESDKDNVSEAFENFIRFRYEVYDKLTAANPNASNDTLQPHYGLNSQEVLLPAFQYAYQGREISSFDAKPHDPFLKIPIPNWRIDYNGLSQVEFFKKYFSSFTLSHAYSSVYNITSFTTSLEYNREPEGFSTATNNRQELIPYFIVNQVTVQERMAPLVG